MRWFVIKPIISVFSTEIVVDLASLPTLTLETGRKFAFVLSKSVLFVFEIQT